MPLLLVRHAKALAHHRWNGPSAERPLTEKGLAQAERLVATLDNLAMGAKVFCSPARRCRQTLAPWLASSGLEPSIDYALLEGSSAARPMELLTEAEHRMIVVCSHGDVLGDALRLITMRGAEVHGIEPGAMLRIEQASVWSIDVADGLPVTATYHPPV